MANRSVTVAVEQDQVTVLNGGSFSNRLTMTAGDVLTVFHSAILSDGGTISVSPFSSAVWTSTANMSLAEGATQTRTVKVGASTGTINLTCSETGSSNGFIFLQITGSDPIPDQFDLGPDKTANPSEVTYFSPVTLTGMDAGVNVTATATNGEVALQSGTTAERTFAASKVAQLGDTLLTRATAPTGYSQSKTFTLSVSGVSDSVVLSTPTDPSSGTQINLGITSGAISMDNLLDLFMGQSQGFWGYTRPTDMGSLYKNGTYVPNISANASVPTSGAISIGNFYGAATSYYLVSAPENKFVFTDTSTGSGSYYASLYWEFGVDWDVGYGIGQRYNTEIYYVVNQTVGSVTVSAGSSYSINNLSILLSKTVSGQTEEFNSGTVTAYFRSLVDNTVTSSVTFNYAINFFGPQVIIMSDETVTINDVEYPVSDLTNEQQYFLAQVNDLRGKTGQLRFQLDQLAISEQHFSKMLIESVEGEPEEKTVNQHDVGLCVDRLD